MPLPPLVVPPDHWSPEGDAIYNTSQSKGLRADHSDELFQGAVRGGYSAAVDSRLFDLVRREVRKYAAGSRLDILEIGGGPGRFMDAVQKWCDSYTNVEPSDAPLTERDRQRRSLPSYRCIRCSAERLPLGRACVDLAISIASLDHVPDPASAISEVARVLRPRGVFIVVLNNRGSWWKRALRDTAYLRRRQDVIARQHYVQWTGHQLVEALGSHFGEVTARSTTFFPYARFIWRIALPVADVLGPRLLPLGGSNTIAVARSPKDSSEDREQI